VDAGHLRPGIEVNHLDLICCKIEWMPETLKILFLAAEAEPFLKVGGLADVAGSLPLALRSLPLELTRGVILDVRLVLPLHRSIRPGMVTLHPVVEFQLARQGGELLVRVFETNLGGMPVYFINGEPIASASMVYSNDPALDREKYAFFCMAALEMARHMHWHPDIIHANDWHTALAVYALRFRPANPDGKRTHSLLTIHNLAYMGGDAAAEMGAYGLASTDDESLPAWARSTPLPLGLLAADALVPVSPGYAREILTPELGCGLDGFLRSRSNSVTGILNGLDLAAWDPATDKNLPKDFSMDDLSGRAINKTDLQRKLGLEEEPHIPILAMVGRIDPQKGVDIALEALNQLGGRAWQFVILGSGDPALENSVRLLQADFPERVRAVIGYDAPLSRVIYGAADMFLMPSRFEPCGLAQMIAMRYGCVPVVRATGGLKDTVQEGKTGFLFQAADRVSLLDALRRALDAFMAPMQWEHLQRNGMLEDFSWTRSAACYAMIYRSLSSS
jgi:starch synthase